VALLAVCLAVAAGLGLAGATYWRLVQELQGATVARAGVAEKATEAEELERQLAQIGQEQAALEEVLQKRFLWSRFLADLRASMPEEVWLTDLSLQAADLTLEGGAESPLGVARFVEQLALLDGVREPKLVKVEGDSELKFTVKAVLERPLLPERGEGD
jgi:Tfp pilus assembly protein PilN